MSTTIKYTYLKQQTWLYRRNYPRDLQGVLGAQAMKQSLKTGDAKLAKARSAEVNAKYEEIVRKARQGIVATPHKPPAPVRVAPAVFSSTGPVIGRDKVAALARLYLNKRSDELRPGGFKSVRFSIDLLASLYGTRQIGSLTRDDGKTFLRLIAELAPHPIPRVQTTRDCRRQFKQPLLARRKTRGVTRCLRLLHSGTLEPLVGHGYSSVDLAVT